VSDIDFFTVVKSSVIIEELKRLLVDVCKDNDMYEVDLAWEYLENMDGPLVEGYPCKFLTIYQEDFRGII